MIEDAVKPIRSTCNVGQHNRMALNLIYSLDKIHLQTFEIWDNVDVNFSGSHCAPPHSPAKILYQAVTICNINLGSTNHKIL